jgi:hypothetical protein
MLKHMIICYYARVCLPLPDLDCLNNFLACRVLYESLFFRAAALCSAQMKKESNLLGKARAAALKAGNEELTATSTLTPDVTMSVLDALFDRAVKGAVQAV